MNKIILQGRLTKENKLEQSKDGKTKILRNAIAVKRDKTTTDFFNVTFLGKLAELVDKYTTKGNRILVEGELHNQSYTDKDGNVKTFTSVLVNNIDLIDFKDNNKPEEELPY